MPDLQPPEPTLERVTAAFSGRYRIEGELGAGGMARVFVAEDAKLGRRVAVKVLRPGIMTGLGVDRFLRETEVAAGLNHPHIVPVLDRGEADGFLYYVMSLVEGETLRAVLERSGALPPADVVRILRDIVDGLDHAHTAGVLHRDIKPENVMISGRHALVTDFGVSKVLAVSPSSQQLTSVGLAIGTPAYMSPEQAVGDQEIDWRSDIYSVGVLAYELLTGGTPFTGTPRKVLTDKLTATPRPILETRPEVEPELAAVVMRCLAADPADRYETMGSLHAALEAVAVRLPGPAPHRTRRGGRRLVTVLGTAAVLAIFAVWAFQVREGTRSAALAVPADRIVVLPFRTPSDDPSLENAGLMAAEWVTQGLDREEIGAPVPAPSVVRMLATAGGEADPVSAVLDATDANILVSGSVLREGDAFILSTSAVDVATGGTIGVTAPVRSSSLSEAVTLATQRVQGLLATHLNFGKSYFVRSPPPNMEVYRELLMARDAFYRGDFATAIRRFARIGELAPDYRSHLTAYAVAEFWTGDYAAAESILTEALTDPGRLTSNERLGVEYMLATVRGNLQDEYRLAMARKGADPTLVYNAALAALRNHRPAEALEVFSSVDLESPLARLFAALWAVPPVAHHALGHDEASLAAARRARERYPSDLGVLNLEIPPAAALGDQEALDRSLGEALTMTGAYEVPPTDTPGWSMILAGLELSAHGYDAQSDEMLERAVAWYEAETVRRPDDTGVAFGSAIAHYYGGELEAADSAFAALLRSEPDNIDFLGFLGVAAARTGDLPTARDMAARLAALDGKWEYGRHTRWRARIAAQSDRPDEAVGLLRAAFAQGISLHFGQDWAWLHIDPDLRPLRGREDFETFIAPREGPPAQGRRDSP